MRGAAGCALPFRGRRTWCVVGRRRSAGGVGLSGFQDGGGAREDIDAVRQVAAGCLAQYGFGESAAIENFVRRV
jgi:hypothetical protein